MFDESVKERYNKGILQLVLSILYAVVIFLLHDFQNAVYSLLLPLIFLVAGLYRIITIDKFKNKYYKVETIAEPVNELGEKVIDHSEQLQKEIKSEARKKQTLLHSVELFTILTMIVIAQLIYIFFAPGSGVEGFIGLIIFLTMILEDLVNKDNLTILGRIKLCKIVGSLLIVFSPLLGTIAYVRSGETAIAFISMIGITIIGGIILNQVRGLKIKLQWEDYKECEENINKYI